MGGSRASLDGFLALLDPPVFWCCAGDSFYACSKICSSNNHKVRVCVDIDCPCDEGTLVDYTENVPQSCSNPQCNAILCTNVNCWSFSADCWGICSIISIIVVPLGILATLAICLCKRQKGAVRDEARQQQDSAKGVRDDALPRPVEAVGELENSKRGHEGAATRNGWQEFPGYPSMPWMMPGEGMPAGLPSATTDGKTHAGTHADLGIGKATGRFLITDSDDSPRPAKFDAWPSDGTGETGSASSGTFSWPS